MPEKVTPVREARKNLYTYVYGEPQILHHSPNDSHAKYFANLISTTQLNGFLQDGTKQEKIIISEKR